MIMTKKDDSNDPSIDAATAALKGMLGIGSAAVAAKEDIAAAASSVTVETVDDAPLPVATEPKSNSPSQLPPQQSTKKKNNSNRRKKNKSAAGENSIPPKAPSSKKKDETAAAVSVPAPSSGGSNANASGKKKKQKQAKKKEPENFAWSAFQSSPDASKLPIPAFHSPPTGEVKKVEPPADLETSNQMTLPLQTDEVAAKVEEIVADKSEPEEEEVEVPLSKTGIDLAAALAPDTTRPSSSHPLPPRHTPQPSLPPSQNSPYSYPYSGPGPSSAPPPFHPYPPQYQQQQPLQHPASSNYSPYPSYNMPHHQQPPPPPPAPPGYVTLFVPVPHVLLPGRQMVVTSPNGYPVQVVVPDGLPPGMVLPVHVPVGAPPPHMQQQMMPPPAPNGAPHHPHMQQQQQAQPPHPQAPPQNHN